MTEVGRVRDDIPLDQIVQENLPRLCADGEDVLMDVHRGDELLEGDFEEGGEVDFVEDQNVGLA